MKNESIVCRFCPEYHTLNAIMSRPGKCLDNAPMEGFWGILKAEMHYPRRFDEHDELCDAIAAHINFYNNERYQKNLNCMTTGKFSQSGDK